MRRLLMTALRTLELEDGPQPEIPPGWLRLDMTASGLGLTQLQLLSGSTSTGGLPRVLGHEMVGRVSELGAGVAAPAVGSLVVVDCLFGCGRCDRCLEGSEVVCPDFRMIGYTIDGGYAEQVVVPAANAFVLPEGIRTEEAVMLASAVPSAVRAVRRADIRPGRRVAVIGAGSVGDLIAQVARASGAHVVLADTDASRLRHVSAHAQATIHLSRDDSAAKMREAIGGDLGADVVFEAAGSRDALELAMSLTRPGGTLMAVGLPPGALAFAEKTVREAVVQEITVRGTFAYSRTDFPQVIGLYEQGHLDLAATMADPVRLADVPRVAQEMFERGTSGRRHPVLVR